MFAQKDLQQISRKGILIDDIYRQIRFFETGFPAADIYRPATSGHGIMVLTKGDESYYRDQFRRKGPGFHITRFIPASGAATRMFKSLFSAVDHLNDLSIQDQKRWIESEPEIRSFFSDLTSYPFYEDLKSVKDQAPVDVLKIILGEPGLNYGSKPKGLLKFHKYNHKIRRSAFEEHIIESAEYCSGREGSLRLHLTVSPDHLDGFQTEAARILPRIEKETKLNITVSYSFQKPETDTIAVNPDNEPFRNPDGSLLFRPGGHGALIQNLDALDSDIIFISNIDNVAPDRLKDLRVHYKMVLGGVLLEMRSRVFSYLQELTGEERVDKSRVDIMINFIHEYLGLEIPDHLAGMDNIDLRNWLIEILNRPIRVCGMVKNEGEPGGGPFYVKSESGEITLQIVESSQINREDPLKAKLLEQSTHFNPVDLVCSIRDFKGKKFQLENFIDQNTGFISEKSIEGKTVKALELPGLWNGAMARWLTLFVEVPIETFTPVKTIFDLMREEHLT